ncbi:MAG: helicase C-terminal domain-containing protein, partial [Planctomycetota bacterium]
RTSTPCQKLLTPKSTLRASSVKRGMMLQRFVEDGRAVLFGVSSFWQGVDVRGDALRNVIITRLPFESPDRPLTKARLEKLQAEGGDPFRQDSLPRAILRFRQGFGRLIRSGTDRGQVVVLDARIATKGYGQAFLDALPDGVRPEWLDEGCDPPYAGD